MNDIWCKKGRLWASLPSSKGDRFYYLGFDRDRNQYCTGPSYYYQTGTDSHHRCKHLRRLMVWLQLQNIKEIMSELNMPYSEYYIPSSLETINTMFRDPEYKDRYGWPVGVLISLFSESRKGKSSLVTQESLHTANQMKKNVLLIQLESKDGYFHTEPWVKKMNRRFKTDFGIEHWYFDIASYWTSLEKYDKGNYIGQVKKFSFDLDKFWKKKVVTEGKGRVICMRLDSLILLAILCGNPGEMTISKGGSKYDFKLHHSRLIGQFWRTPLFNTFVKENIGVVVIDSMSEPIKELLTGGQQKFPARSDIQASILIPLDKMVANRNIVAFTISHETRDKSRPDKPKAYGGGMNEYAHKFEVSIFAGKVDDKTSRTLLRVRFPDLPEQQLKTVKASKKKQLVKLTNNGFIDIIEEDKPKKKKTKTEVKKK